MEEEEEEETCSSSSSDIIFQDYDTKNGKEFTFNSNGSGWNTKIVFRAWFYEVFVPQAREYLRNKGEQEYGVLLLDNASCHLGDLITEDQAFFVAYLPPRTTSHIQPCDQHIIMSTKAKYRKRMGNALNSISLDENIRLKDLVDQVEYYDFASLVTECWCDVKVSEKKSSWNSLLFDHIEGEDKHHIMIS